MKKTIRLTESDLRKVISESVKSILTENGNWLEYDTNNTQASDLTIEQMAEMNDCETKDEFGLAEVWSYWLDCNTNDMQSLNDFNRLDNYAKQRMFNFLKSEPSFSKLFDHICNNLFRW